MAIVTNIDHALLNMLIQMSMALSDALKCHIYLLRRNQLTHGSGETYLCKECKTFVLCAKDKTFDLDFKSSDSFVVHLNFID